MLQLGAQHDYSPNWCVGHSRLGQWFRRIFLQTWRSVSIFFRVLAYTLTNVEVHAAVSWIERDFRASVRRNRKTRGKSTFPFNTLNIHRIFGNKRYFVFTRDHPCVSSCSDRFYFSVWSGSWPILRFLFFYLLGEQQRHIQSLVIGETCLHSVGDFKCCFGICADVSAPKSTVKRNDS